MSATASATATQSYTVADIEKVMRRVSADLVMIASSSAAITEEAARKYANDIELLAYKGYLEKVDITLFSGSTEIKAVCFTVNTASGDLTTARPGGVLWPRMTDPDLRIVLSYNATYTATARQDMQSKLQMNWTPTTEDTSHAALNPTSGRDYVSSGYGMQRKDWA